MSERPSDTCSPRASAHGQWSQSLSLQYRSKVRTMVESLKGPRWLVQEHGFLQNITQKSASYHGCQRLKIIYIYIYIPQAATGHMRHFLQQVPEGCKACKKCWLGTFWGCLSWSLSIYGWHAILWLDQSISTANAWGCAECEPYSTTAKYIMLKSNRKVSCCV